MRLRRPAPGTAKWWALGIAFTLAVVGWAGLRELSVAGQRITAQTTGWTVLDERTVAISFEVRKPVDVTVSCTLQAEDLKHAVVGSATATVGPSSERSTRHEATIRTTTKAFAARVYSCVRA